MNPDPTFSAPFCPLLLVVSAPSGAGKTTLCERLRAEFPALTYSVSCTTRAPREGERDGADYHFLSEAEFGRRLEAGEFLEHAEVHGHRYGTLRRTVAEGLAAGRDVLLDIDVQGAAQIRARLAAAAEGDPIRRGYADLFIAPPSLDELRRRLERRGTDARETIERRLQKAGAEMARASEYDYVLVNDDLDRAYGVLRAILVAERHRVR